MCKGFGLDEDEKRKQRDQNAHVDGVCEYDDGMGRKEAG